MKYNIWTLGCQMNKSDSERIASLLENAEWKACSCEEEADLIIVVACSVRQSAIDRIYGRSAKYEKLKKKNKNLKTILTGCVLETDKRKLAERFDVVCDIREINIIMHKLSSRAKSFEASAKDDEVEGSLSNKLAQGKGISPLRSPSFFGLASVGMTKGIAPNYSYLSITPKYTSAFQAYVPIMTGCNNFCAYCVVPYTRGREYSRSARNILDEVNQLIKSNNKEITLLGQNVNSYKGSLNGENIDFPKLLKIINNIKGNFWIRFITSHPKDMSDELINTIAECEKVCPYIHLPIQAGSNKILKLMNRGYTKEHYLNLIKKIKEKIPDVMLSTDVIVGFPNETEKDFKSTLDVFKKVKYTMAYIARYSPRANTAAFKLKDNVTPLEKAKREHILTDVLKQTALENNKKFLGKTIAVLVEKKLDNGYMGKTRQFTNVKFHTTGKRCSFPAQAGAGRQADHISPEGGQTFTRLHIGQFIDIKIIKAASWGMEGKISIKQNKN